MTCADGAKTNVKNFAKVPRTAVLGNIVLLSAKNLADISTECFRVKVIFPHKRATIKAVADMIDHCCIGRHIDGETHNYALRNNYAVYR